MILVYPKLGESFLLEVSQIMSSFAEHQDNVTYVLGFELKMKRNIFGKVGNHTLALDVTLVIVLLRDISCKVLLYTGHITQLTLIKEFVIFGAPTQKSFVKRSV